MDKINSYEETTYLSASPKNTARLNAAVAEIEAGQSKERGLIATE